MANTSVLRGLGLVVLIILAVGFVIDVIAFATPGWQKYGSSGMGLWQLCHGSRCADLGSSDWMDATRAFECLGLICYFIALLVFILQMFVNISRVNLIVGITGILAGVFILIGVIIFGAKVEKHLHYSFGLAIIAALLAFVGGALSIVKKPSPT